MVRKIQLEDSSSLEHILSDIQKSNLFYQHLVEVTPDAIVVHSEGKIVYANPKALQLIGAHDTTDLVGKSVMKFIHPDSLPLINARIQKLLNKNMTAPFIEEKFITLTGDTVIAETKAVPFTFQDKPAILAILHDVTLRKKQEERQAFLDNVSALLSETLDYKKTLETISKLLVPFLADYIRIVIVSDNKHIEDVITYHVDSKKLSAAKKLYSAYKDKNGMPQGVGHILETGKAEFMNSIDKESVIKLPNGEKIWNILTELGFTSYMGIPLKIRDKVRGAITFSSTKRERIYTREDVQFAEEIARRIAYAIENATLYHAAQKAIELRDEFISVASHELKTPLTSLKLYLQVLQKQLEKNNSDTYNRPMQKMNEQIDRLTQLINDLLHVSKLQHGKLEFTLEEVDLNELIKDAIEIIQSTDIHHRIIFHGRITKKIIIDKHRISQVITNLLSNAIKYSPEADKVVITLQEKNNEVRIAVQDFGIGIDKIHLKKIFQQFYRVDNSYEKSYPGLGLGLYIAYEIVQRHGGTMQVTSKKNVGSTFSFTLPIR